jgi:hypothetical protein
MNWPTHTHITTVPRQKTLVSWSALDDRLLSWEVVLADFNGMQIHTISSDVNWHKLFCADFLIGWRVQVFMFGTVMWQAVTGIWAEDLTSSLMQSGFWSCFDEGKGLIGYDVGQVCQSNCVFILFHFLSV